MSHEWMIDVLVDLRQYALKNYYVGLAEQLDEGIVDEIPKTQSCAVISL